MLSIKVSHKIPKDSIAIVKLVKVIVFVKLNKADAKLMKWM